MKKWLKRAGIAVGIPIGFVLLVGVLFYLPPVQNWIVHRVAAYASEKTGMEISVSHVRLSFPLDLNIEGVKVIQPTRELPLQKDTIADVKCAIASVRLLPLLCGKVEVDRLDINQVKLNTMHLIADVRVSGSFGHLSLTSHGIDLRRDTLLLDKAKLADANICVALADTAQADTAKSKVDWQIAVGRLDILRSRVRVSLPGDTLQLDAYIDEARAVAGHFDLGEKRYQLAKFDLQGGQMAYDNQFEPNVEGMDFNHLRISQLNAGIDSLHYDASSLSLRVRKLTLKEKSGWELTELCGPVALTNDNLRLPVLKLRTPTSQLVANVDMDLNAFANTNPGKMGVKVHATLGKQDLMRLLANQPDAFKRQWPVYPLVVDGELKGSRKSMNIERLYVKLPTAFRAHVTGRMANLDQSDRLKADLNVQLHAQKLAFVKSFLSKDLQQQINIPNHLAFKGNIGIDGSRYATRFTADIGTGNVNGQLSFDSNNTSYHANLVAHDLPLQSILPHQNLSSFSGDIYADGRGVDLLSPRMAFHAKVHVKHFRYGSYDLTGLAAEATSKDGRTNVSISLKNALADGQLTLYGLSRGRRMCATVTTDMRQLDLHRLNVTSEPFTLGLCGHFDVCTDLKDYYQLTGLVSDIKAYNRGETHRMEDLTLDLLTRRDTTHALTDCGDFHLDLSAHGGYQTLLDAGDGFMAELQKQWENRRIDQLLLRERLPLARVELSGGKNNLIARMVNYHGYQFKSLSCDMTSSPIHGINGNIHIDSLVTSGVQLDTIHLAVVSDSLRTNYICQVRNNQHNPQYVFNALLNGSISSNGTQLIACLYDGHDKLGVRLGLSAAMEEDGVRISSYGQDPVLGYKTFHINDDNYAFLGNDKRVLANVQLLADDGTGVQIYSDSTHTEALQDITLSLHRFDLEKVLAVVPYAPAITGTLSGDYHLIQTSEALTVSSNMSIDSMTYEKCPMGNLSTEFVYMPKADGSHYVDGILMSDETEIATIQGSYLSEDEGALDATLHMEHLPLSMLNGFVEDQIIGLGGYGDGDLSVKGSLSKPNINGEIFLDSAYVFSEPYGVEMRFDDDPVTITNSRLLFENFQMYAHNDSPLVMSGYFDFTDFDNMKLSVRVRAQNYLLIDAKENARSETYGKAYVNFAGMVSGPLEGLKMRGRLDVLGSTDMTYILRDSPLTTDNQMDELVKFVNFNDTTQDVVSRPPLTGLDVDLTLAIDENAHIMCALNADHSNYIDLEGGGNLRLQYNSVDNMRLTGRYTLNNGQMKYSLPVIPLKTFTIQDGSYIEFLGDPMNPKLNITATEQTKSSVSSSGGSGHTVVFESGVVITKTLKDMGLQFIIDAPEDMTIHNELQTMSAEERGKLAVTMLTTGMYLADGNTKGFSMNSALSAFLNSQINAISGNALRTLDVSFGMDNTTTASGSLHTDYSFKFAKRFWNNRLRIVVGGKVSSGAEIENQNNSFFDNVTFEYRLNQNASQYLKMFYQRDSYDWLDGNVSQFGVGFMWKRKLNHFKDIFRFKSEKDNVPPAASKDTTKTAVNENGK